MLMKIHCIQFLKIVVKLRKSELLKIKMESQEDLDMLNSLIVLQPKRVLPKLVQMLKEELLELTLLNQTKDQVVIEEAEEASVEEETEETEEAEEASVASVEEAVIEAAAEDEVVSEAVVEEET